MYASLSYSFSSDKPTAMSLPDQQLTVLHQGAQRMIDSLLTQSSESFFSEIDVPHRLVQEIRANSATYPDFRWKLQELISSSFATLPLHIMRLLHESGVCHYMDMLEYDLLDDSMLR